MTTKGPTSQKPTSKQIKFAQLVASGITQTEAYRKAYNRPDLPDKTAWERSCNNAKIPHVAAEIARIRAKSEVKVLLSLNDRLGMMAASAQKLGEVIQSAKRPSEVASVSNAQARVVEVYSKISGDQAPERHEVTGANGAPIPVAATVTTLSKRDKINAILAASRAPKP